MANVTRWGEYRFRSDVPDISGGVIEGRYLTMGHADGPRSGDIIYLAARSWELQTGWLVQGVHDDFPADYSPTYEYEMTVVRVGADMVLYAPVADNRDGIGLRYDPAKPKGYVGRALVAGDDLPNITPPPGSVATYLYDYDSLSKTARVGDTALYNGVEWMYAAKTATLYTAWTGTANASTSTLSTVGSDGSTPHDFDTGEWVRTANLKPKPLMAVGDKWRVISSTILDFMDASGTVVYQLDSPDEPKYIGVNLGDQALYYDKSNRPIVKWVWDGEKWNKQPLVQYLDQLAARNISADEAVVKMLSANIVSSDTFRTKSGRAGFNDDGFYAKDVVGNTTFEVDGETGDVSITGKVIRSKKTIDQWYGDTTIPGVPTGITASAALNMIFVDWDGTLSGGVPEDFGHIAVYVDGQLGGTMDESGSLTFGTYQTGSGHDVTARSFDKATPTPNQSALSAKVHVDVDGALSSSSTEWAQNSDPVNAPTSGWQQTPPTWVAGKYIWMRTTITTGDGAKSTTAPVVITGNPGSQGAQGNGITSKSIDYQVSDSGTSVPVGTWTATIPASSPGQYLWTRTTLGYRDGTTTMSYGVSRNGSNGATGADGRGVKSAIVSYQLSTSGTNVPTGSWSSSPLQQTASTPFLWSRTVFSYSDNTTSTTYSISKLGDTGAQGISVTSVTRFYQLSTSTPSQPTTANPDSPWSTNEPGYTPLWVKWTGTPNASTSQLFSSDQGPSSKPVTSSGNLYYVDRVLYSNGQFSYSPVQTSSSYALGAMGVDVSLTAVNTADSKVRIYAQGTEPTAPPRGFSTGDMWLTTDSNGQTSKISVWNGSAWAKYILIASEVIVPSSIGNVLIADGAITGNKVSANTIDATNMLTVGGSDYFPNPQFIDGGPMIGDPDGDIPAGGGKARLLQNSDHFFSQDCSFPVVAGEQYVLTFEAYSRRGTAGLSGGMWLYGITGSGMNPWDAYTNTFDDGPCQHDPNWHKYHMTCTVPGSASASAATAVPCIMVNQSSDDHSTNWSVANCHMRKVNDGVLIADGAITANKADIASIASALVTSGQFKTTDGTVGFDSTNGFWVKDSNGNYLFRANKNGVNLNNVGLSAPTITGGDISGTTLTGNTIRTSTGSDRTEMNTTGVTVYKGGTPYAHMGSDSRYGLQAWNPTTSAMQDISSTIFGSWTYSSNEYLSTRILTNTGNTDWTFEKTGDSIITDSGRILVMFSIGNNQKGDNQWISMLEAQVFFTTQPHGQFDQTTSTKKIADYGLVAGTYEIITGMTNFGLFPASQFQLMTRLPKGTPLYPAIGILAYGTSGGDRWSGSIRQRNLIIQQA